MDTGVEMKDREKVHKLGAATVGLAILFIVGAGLLENMKASVHQENTIIDLWSDGVATFGVFVPDERPREQGRRGQRSDNQRQPPLYTVEGGKRLAENPLYDFVFLNLEGSYDASFVEAIAEGLASQSAVSRKALLVRIPPIERDGQKATQLRVREVLEKGADGVVFPHIRSPEEARMAIRFMTEAGSDLWSASNPSGDKIAMIMIEDPDSLARIEETANVPGIGILACGIGSLTGALGGDREAAEAGNQKVLAEAKRIRAVDMITANSNDVSGRVEEGFLALLMRGAGADEAIQIGRVAAGR
jgi:2-keto-3-deoxy-L-rhamnonate aldolase RhmA|tara:strand:- start:2968 stop:3876 length:909 start_codon:yes stop_codon:yes gene_type:complete